jgi:hypothetical protein
MPLFEPVSTFVMASSVRLFELERLPLMKTLLAAVGSVASFPPPAVSIMPGIVARKETKSRPLMAMSFDCEPVTRPERSAVAN